MKYILGLLWIWLAVLYNGYDASAIPTQKISSGGKDICNLPPDTETCEAKKKLSIYFLASTNSCTQFLDGGCKKYDNKFQTWQQCIDTCGGIRNDVGWLFGMVAAHSFQEVNDEVVQWDIKGFIKITGSGYIDSPTFQLTGHNWFLRLFSVHNVTCVYLRKVTNETKHSITVSLSVKADSNELGKRERKIQKHEGLLLIPMCMHTSAFNFVKDKPEIPVIVSCSIRQDDGQMSLQKYKNQTKHFKTESVTALSTSDDEKDQCSQPPDTETCETGKKMLYYYYREATNSCTPFLDGNCNKYNNKFKDGPKCMETCGGIGQEARWLLDMVSADSFREVDDEVVQWDINQIMAIIGSRQYIDTPTFRLADHNWFIRLFRLYRFTCIYLFKVSNETKHSVAVSLSVNTETNVLVEKEGKMQKEHEAEFRVSTCMHTSTLDSLKDKPEENTVTVSCSIRLNEVQGDYKSTETDY